MFSISILIPVYNYDVSILLESLKDQITTNLNEVIIIDDCSSNSKITKNNIEYCQKNNFQYYVNNSNLGRTKTRQKLALKANAQKLLFIDVDTIVPNKDFLQKFINEAHNNDVVFGGISYGSLTNHNYSLRWKYGVNRESRNLKKRNITPYLSVISGCFLIDKLKFLKISEALNFNLYGMDVLFSYQMKKLNLRIKHIDNPIIHIGLEENSEFIKKTEKGLDTLTWLSHKKLIPSNYRPIQIKLNQLKKLKICSSVGSLFKLFRPLIVKQLSSKNPSLRLFDIYRLGYLCYKSNVK